MQKGLCRMKKLLLLVLAIMLCLSLCSCTSVLGTVKSWMTGETVSKPPEDFVAEAQNDEFSYEIYDSYIKITKYISENTEAVIPEEIDDRPVTVIGSLCFYQTTEVVSVEIPDSVKTIESQAFYCATKLVSVDVPDSVEFIGERAFAWCSSLESVTLGNGISEIANYCFNSCTSLASLTIGDNIRQIGMRAFSYCEKLTEFTVEEKVEKVGERAFEKCTALEYAVFENSSTELGKLVFNESFKVAVISEKDSPVMNYCEENGLRWSESKDVEAVILGGEKVENTSENTSAQ
jgi:hypothetical protein